MHIILDLDLDFFVWPIAHWVDEERRSETEYTKASEQDVRHFLEEHCHLDKTNPIPGRQVIEHYDAFTTWRDWIAQGKLSVPFEVIHVDAHADLGKGGTGWIYLISKLLALPVDARSDPPIDPYALNSGNYLAYAVANQWISDLTCVYPTAYWTNRVSECRHDEEIELRRKPPDLNELFFRDRNPETALIELPHFSEADAKLLARKDDLVPIRTEPPVPFQFGAAKYFDFRGFTHMIVAQSPQYTPASADALLTVIREYFSLA